MIKFVVKAKKQWNLKNRELVRQAVKFVVDKYDLHDQDITVKLGGYIGWLGSAMRLHDGRFVVHINSAKFGKLWILDTVFHEFTHVHQYRAGFLKLATDGAAVWHYTKINNKAKGFAYWRAPWEVEARTVAKVILRAFLREAKNNS